VTRNRIFRARHRRPEPRRRVVPRLGAAVLLCGLLAGTGPALAASSTPSNEQQTDDRSSPSTISFALEIPDANVRPPCDDLPDDFPDCDDAETTPFPAPPTGCNAWITKSVTRTSGASVVKFNGRGTGGDGRRSELPCRNQR
jgi:hypothetical protein